MTHNFRSIQDSDHRKGKKNARVVLIEYGDYECVFSQAAYPLVEALLHHFKNDLLFAYRHFPNTHVHSHAELAAQAAEAAGRQGKFWSMHQQLFTSHGQLSKQSLLRYAASIGLDIEIFTKSLESEELRQRVNSDFLSGESLGIRTTPSFLVDGELFRGDWTLGQLTRIIEAKLSQGSETLQL